MLNILCATHLSQLYPVNLQRFSCRHVKNSVDSDQIAKPEASRYGSNVFSKSKLVKQDKGKVVCTAYEYVKAK